MMARHAQATVALFPYALSGTAVGCRCSRAVLGGTGSIRQSYQPESRAYSGGSCDRRADGGRPRRQPRRGKVLIPQPRTNPNALVLVLGVQRWWGRTLHRGEPAGPRMSPARASRNRSETYPRALGDRASSRGLRSAERHGAGDEVPTLVLSVTLMAEKTRDFESEPFAVPHGDLAAWKENCVTAEEFAHGS